MYVLVLVVVLSIHYFSVLHVLFHSYNNRYYYCTMRKRLLREIFSFFSGFTLWVSWVGTDLKNLGGIKEENSYINRDLSVQSRIKESPQIASARDGKMV